KLLTVASLGEVLVTAHLPEAYTRNFGKVRNVPFEYTTDKLLEYLKEFGVVSVQRRVAHRRHNDG
ncbi:hypothetical protein HPB47_025084, partial [Ixodes persulcatus]